MMILMMCVATAVAVSDPGIKLKFGLKWTIIGSAAVAFTAIAVPNYSMGEWRPGGNIALLIPYFAIVAACLIVAARMFHCLHDNKTFRIPLLHLPAINRIKAMKYAALAMCVLFTLNFIMMGKSDREKDMRLISRAIEGKSSLALDDDGFWRIDVLDNSLGDSVQENLGAYFAMPSIRSFISTVPASTMNFYAQIGIVRQTSSMPPISNYQLRAFFSTKYLLIPVDEKNQSPMPGFSFHETQGEYNIYLNDYYVPFGFAYDSYLDESTWSAMNYGDRVSSLLSALYLTDDQARRFSNMMNPLGEPIDSFSDDVAARRSASAYEFSRDATGFTSKIKLERPSLVFFSVPYEAGWSAEVNGKPVSVERVSIGFMAVPCPAGDNVIRYVYSPPGLKVGLYVSATSLLCLVAWMVGTRRFRKYSGIGRA
jgi:uncharacterized membrane protein YfhO